MRVCLLLVCTLVSGAAFAQTCPESKTCSTATVLTINNTATSGVGLSSWGNYSGVSAKAAGRF